METQEQKVARVIKEDVAVVPYDSRWPEMFARERDHLLSCLPRDVVRRIEHFGSTAVPGLAAKPIVDMLVEVASLDETKRRIVPILESQGGSAANQTGATAPAPRIGSRWSPDSAKDLTILCGVTPRYDYFWRPSWGDDTPPFYAWFIRRDGRGNRTHHIHMVEADFEHWERLLFRDYLIEHPDVAQAYGDLKTKLSGTHHHDRIAYTQAKGDFVKRVTAEAKRYYEEGRP